MSAQVCSKFLLSNFKLLGKCLEQKGGKQTSHFSFGRLLVKPALSQHEHHTRLRWSNVSVIVPAPVPVLATTGVPLWQTPLLSDLWNPAASPQRFVSTLLLRAHQQLIKRQMMHFQTTEYVSSLVRKLRFARAQYQFQTCITSQVASRETPCCRGRFLTFLPALVQTSHKFSIPLAGLLQVRKIGSRSELPHLLFSSI